MFSDSVTTYNVSNFYRKDAETKSSLQYLIWKSIFEVPTGLFDFEGSMLKDIEFFLRAFGGKLTPHYKVHKVHNPLLKLALTMFKPQFFD